MEVMMERCYHALDTRRVRFQDTEGVCSVASAGAVAVPAMVAICLLAQPVAMGVVVIIGTVVVAAIIKEELEAHARWRRAHPEAEASRPVAETQPIRQAEPEADPRLAPRSSPSSRDPLPPPPQPSRRPECEPLPTPHLGGDALHNRCADNVPLNDFRGFDALVNSKRFDALELGRRVLWEIKTDNFGAYSPDLQRIVIGKQVAELKRERDLARACGYEFYVGVLSAAHRAALLAVEPSLNIVVMDWC
jgi:hypothetical protein